MKWSLAKPADGDRLKEFLLPREHTCVSFTYRINEGGKIAIPPRKKIQILITRAKKKGEFTGAVLQTKYGFIFPVFQKKPSPDLILKMKSYSSYFFSVMGTKKNVNAVNRLIDKEPQNTIEYYIMTQESFLDSSFVTPPELKIKRADVKDAERLYPLQELYEKEEVLINPATFNKENTMRFLKKDIIHQIVYLAEYKGTPIAKAGTNAKGFGYDQLGGVFTMPQFRNRGFAGYLMKPLLEEINQHGKLATLFVKKGNGPAIGLYKKLGFSVKENFSISYY